MENGVTEGGDRIVSRFSCFRIEKKRLFEFRRSKLFRFRKCVFRGFQLRMGLLKGKIELFRVFRVFGLRRKDFLSFELRNYFVFESVFFGSSD